MAKYIDYRDIETELSKIFEREIEDHKKKGDFMWSYKINSLKRLTFERLEGLDKASDEIEMLLHKAQEEEREQDAQIYGECYRIILKKLGIECYKIVNGEKIKY